MRNVLIISDGDDMAGVNYGLKAAFDRHSTRYKLRQVRGTNNYIDYPRDIDWQGSNILVNGLYNQADLIHIAEYPWALDGGSAPKIWDQVPKPTVVHQHGTPFRNQPNRYLNLARLGHYTQIVSTIDLLIDKSLTWLPNPVNIEEMQRIRKENYVNDGVVRFGQAPTNRGIKNTADFIKVCEAIKDKHKKFEYFVIENRTWQDTLAVKARCDIWFDQLTFGYGSNGIEAGAMGIGIIGAMADPKIESRLVETVGGVPYVSTSVPALGRLLERLVVDQIERQRMGAQAFDYMQRVHSESVVVKRLEEIYDRTINLFEARR